jgi:hypothetical protein
MKNRDNDACPSAHRTAPVWSRRLICALGLVASFASTAQVEVTQLFYHEVLRQYEQGAVAYEKGDYESAFADLSLAAQRGVKDAQYLLGFMYLQGEYAPRSIPVGMAWLGTALEVENNEWLSLYKKLYGTLNAAQQAFIDNKVDTYIQLYGMDTQRIVCENKPRVGSRRKVRQCIKTEDVNTPLYSLEMMPEGFVPPFSCEGDFPCLAGETRVYSDHDELNPSNL